MFKNIIINLIFPQVNHKINEKAVKKKKRFSKAETQLL